MADIKLTSGDDRFTQSEANKDNWENYFGLDGNDTFKIYQGTVIGGAGNDTIERNPTGEWWRGVQAAYWDSPTGARVDLEAGTADDGWGGRDTLIGVDSVSGSGNDDWFKGNANDNQFWPNNGNDTVFGGAGIDRVTLPWFEPVPGQPWRPTHLEDLDIVVSVDGRSATLRPLQGKGFSYTLTDVETIEVETGAYFSNTYQTYSLADFIESQDMAEQAIAAGGGWRWNASQPLGSATELTYSFVTQAPTGGVGAAGFRTFSAAERQAVRDIFAETSALTGLSFSEVTETAGATGQLRFGVSQQRDTRGVSWLPNQSGAGESAGDVWMDVESMLNLAVGSEGYAALLHEIGHALGLRHPRNVDPGDAWAVQLRESDDRSALTVMSDAYSADGLFRSDWGPLDVLALRYLYGTREHQAGDDQYRLGAHQASGQTTLVDDGGEDTLDASQLTSGVNLDLAAGHLSSVGVTGAGFNGVENLGLTIGSEIEHAIGSAFDDVLLGNALDNVLSGGTGNDWIEGEEGEDTAHFAGPRSEYRVSSAYGKVFVEARDGVSGYDTLSSIERLSFDDQSLAVAASPLGADVDFSVDEDKVFTASLPDPSDVGRGEVSYRLAAAPAHGTATITADGSLHYEPQADFWGVDTLSFEMVGAGSSNQYLSFVEVRPINDAGPVGANATFLTATGALFKARLPEASDLDDDPLTYSVAVAPKGGVVTIVGGSQFVYQSRAGFSGPDSFTYSVSDGMGGSSSYTATINLASVTGQQVWERRQRHIAGGGLGRRLHAARRQRPRHRWRRQRPHRRWRRHRHLGLRRLAVALPAGEEHHPLDPDRPHRRRRRRQAGECRAAAVQQPESGAGPRRQRRRRGKDPARRVRRERPAERTVRRHRAPAGRQRSIDRRPRRDGNGGRRCPFEPGCGEPAVQERDRRAADTAGTQRAGLAARQRGLHPIVAGTARRGAPVEHHQRRPRRPGEHRAGVHRARGLMGGRDGPALQRGDSTRPMRRRYHSWNCCMPSSIGLWYGPTSSSPRSSSACRPASMRSPISSSSLQVSM